MPSNAAHAFEKNRGDVAQLMKIHVDVAGSGSGRKYGVEILNRASIVFVNACWEAYVEDLARESAGHFKRLQTTALPGPLKAAIGKMYQARKNPQDMWKLASDGWRAVLDTYFEQVLGAFNTPRTANVDSLYDELLGITKISSSWSWNGMNAVDAAAKLDGYVTVRGGIVHRVNHSDNEKVYKKQVTDFQEHAGKLVKATDEAVRVHLERLLLQTPWPA